MSNEIEFVDGLIVKPPREGSPDFVKFKISINRKSLGNWLRGKDEDWINIDVKESKGGKLYASVDNFKPDPSRSTGAGQNVQQYGVQEGSQDNELNDPIPSAMGGDIDDDVPF